jgi:hypothetical protein
VSRPEGLRVCYPTKPDWGVGHVVADDGGAKVTVFFLHGGKRTLDTTIAGLDLVTGPAATHQILDVAAAANWKHTHHDLDVLNTRVLDETPLHRTPRSLCRRGH